MIWWSRYPYAFQVEVRGGDLLTGGFIVRDADTHADLKIFGAHVNVGRNCGPYPTDPNLPQQPDSSIQCYPYEGDSWFVARPTLPVSESVYSIEMVTTCDGRPMYTDMRCPSPKKTDAILILTISPPVAPAAPNLPNPPIYGQKFNYTLVSRVNGQEATTPLTAIFVKPNNCSIDDLQAVPIKGSVGDQINLEWSIRNCHSYALSASDSTSPIYAKALAVDVVSEADMNGSTKYQLTDKSINVRFTASAYDAMGNSPATRTKDVSVEPCSISPTHPQCETRCKVTPLPPGCARPPVPQCPSGEGDTNRQKMNFSVQIICVRPSENRTVPELACTESEAQAQVQSAWGDRCTVLTGSTQTPECPNGAAKRDWTFCLACSNTSPTSTKPILHDETRKACFLPNAVNDAMLSYPGEICWLLNEDKCSK